MMARRTEPEPSSAPPARLLRPLAEVQRLIDERIEAGAQFALGRTFTLEDFNRIAGPFSTWDDYNRAMLKQILNTSAFYIDYNRASYGKMGATISERVQLFERTVKEKLRVLQSIRDRLPLYAAPTSDPPTPPAAPIYSRRVFLVHGHDGVKNEVARFLERFDFEPVILHEMPNRGRTVIEKFEDYADVGFAIALLTPDDIGAKAPETNGEPNLSRRARQNVIFELGYFVGRLSRGRVVALYKPPTEIPSDFAGVIYTEIDAAGAWKMVLVRELREAGYEVDVSRIL